MRIAADPVAPFRAQQFDRPIAKGARVGLWLVACAVAAAATVAPSLTLLLFCWLFPMGLAAPFGASEWNSPVATYGTLAVGWSVYIGLSVYGLRQSRRAQYFAAYAILLALLVLNVAGCRYEVVHMKFNC